MLDMSNMYKVMKLNKEWDVVSQREKVMALKAQFQRKIREQRNSRKKGANGGGKPPAKGKLEKPDWLRNHVAPKNVRETREWNSKTHRWCCAAMGGKCNGKWATHSAEQCEGDKFRIRKKPPSIRNVLR